MLAAEAMLSLAGSWKPEGEVAVGGEVVFIRFVLMMSRKGLSRKVWSGLGGGTRGAGREAGGAGRDAGRRCAGREIKHIAAHFDLAGFCPGVSSTSLMASFCPWAWATAPESWPRGSQSGQRGFREPVVEVVDAMWEKHRAFNCVMAVQMLGVSGGLRVEGRIAVAGEGGLIRAYSGL